MTQAMQLTGLTTKKQTIEEALKLLIKVRGQNSIRKIKGKLSWEGNLDKMRKD